MGNVLLEDLQREIEAGSVIAIIGVGVSVAATNNKPAASWCGLLHHGVDHCREHKSLTGVDEKWAKRVHEEIDSGDLDDMLSAAEKSSRKLGAPDGGEYRRWLRETIRVLKAERRDVLEALRDLKVALAKPPARFEPLAPTPEAASASHTTPVPCSVFVAIPNTPRPLLPVAMPQTPFTLSP